ncbi:MAG: energy transducer TonB [Granulicella sp.]
MVKPISSEEFSRPSRQFAHFGVLDAGHQSKASVFTSATINIALILVAILLGLAAKKMSDAKPQVTMLIAPTPVSKPPEIIKPPIIPKLPPPPKVAVQPPKINIPQVKVPELPPQPVVKMNQPAPVLAPAPPMRVIAPPAPAVVSLAHPMAASVPNNDPHPSAVALGHADNPIAPSNRPATSSVNLGQRGLAGMPASNSGSGPAASRVNLGSGSPGGTTLAGNGVRAVQGVKLGVAGGAGPNNATGRVAGQVNLGVAIPPPASKQMEPTSAAIKSGPKVVFKPRPEYSAEARAMHLEGTVSVRLRVSAAGSVEVLGISNGLGHGLDQAAENAVRGTRFQPALDATGRPTDWEGIVNVAFQLAS